MKAITVEPKKPESARCEDFTDKLPTGARGRAGFPTCCVADFPVGGAPQQPSPLVLSYARRLENLRNSRLESLRYERRQTRA